MNKNQYLITIFIIGISLVFGTDVICSIVNTSNGKPNYIQIEKPVNVNYLVKFEITGGLCPYGGCYYVLYIIDDGSIISIENNRTQVGQINNNEINELKTLINTANFDLMKSKPFTGTCPTAYDGAEYIYHFKRSNNEEIISTCKYSIDPKDVLINKIDQLKMKYGKK